MYSIIIATFNSDATFEESLLSVINQTYKDYEIIIIDGKSTDETVNIIKKYNDKIKYWVSESDHGIYDAWNKGIRKASGQWICFFGSDDIMLPDAIETYHNFITNQKNNDLEFISSKIRFVTEDLKTIRTVGEPWEWKKFKHHMNALHPGSMHNSLFFEKYGNYDTKYSIVGDYEVLLRAKDKLKAGFIPYETILMRRTGVSNTFNALKQTKEIKLHHNTGTWLSIQLDYYISTIKLFCKNLF